MTLKSRLISEQETDPELAPLFKLALPPVEPDKVPVCYNVRNGYAKVEATNYPCI